MKEKGKIYRRVTEILYPFTNLNKIPKHIIENAATRGTAVHKTCEAIMKGLLPPSSSKEDPHKLYVDSFLKWWDNTKQVLSIEERFFCDDYRITGQCDLIYKDERGKNILLDLKTSASPSKTWKFQGTAYAYMARKAGYEIDEVQFLQLLKTGLKPKLYVIEEDFEMLTKIIDVYGELFE